MKFVVLIKFYSKTNPGLVYEKEFESDRVPCTGEKVTHPIFATPKTVSNVVHNLKCGGVFVILESKELSDEALKGHLQEVAELHNWQPSKSII